MPIVVPFIFRHHLVFQHDIAQQGSAHNSWKLKMSQFFHGLYTHQICHPLNMFGMLWIDNIQQLRTAIEEFPQATISSLINSMQKRHVTLQEANSGHTRY
jgi:hypothetical protein